MSRLEVMSPPLFVPKRTDPTAVSDDFIEKATALTDGMLSAHSLRTIGERFGLTDEDEVLGWLEVVAAQEKNAVLRYRSVDEIATAVKELVGYKVPAAYAKALAVKYNLVAETREIAQLFVYKLPAEWAAVASIQPWNPYSLQMMHEAGVPAEYTLGRSGGGRAERVSDLSLVELYESGVPHEYALSFATTHKPMRAAALWTHGVPADYLDQYGSWNKRLQADELIAFYGAGLDPYDVVVHLRKGLNAQAVLLVLRDGIPAEYAIAAS